MNAAILFLLAFARSLVAEVGEHGVLASTGERVLRLTVGRNAPASPRNYLARCKGCKAAHVATDAVWANATYRPAPGRPVEHTYAIVDGTTVYLSKDGGGAFSKRCGCGRAVRLVGVQFTYKPEHVCNAKCLNATGPACECSCKGRNHGRNH